METMLAMMHSAADFAMNRVPMARLTLVMIVLRIQLAFERPEQGAPAIFVEKSARFGIDPLLGRWSMKETAEDCHHDRHPLSAKCAPLPTLEGWRRIAA